MDQDFLQMMEGFYGLPEVEAVVLGGSRATGRAQKDSDYDVYVYVTGSIDLEIRRKLTTPYCSYMELANTYWEEEDDGKLMDGTIIEIIYRHVREFENGLKTHLEDHIAYAGYTTCVYDSLLNGKVLYEKKGWYLGLKNKYGIYPYELARNIITKNRELLSGRIPSYDKQIIKAVKRKDYPSVHHRISEFMASYFDIVFALNLMAHPGEKRMMSISTQLDHIPLNMEEQLSEIYEMSNHDNEALPQAIEGLIEALDACIEATDWMK